MSADIGAQPLTQPTPSDRSGKVRLALARHGETVWHANNRYAGGSSDIDLTPAGRRQAQLLAQWCVGFSPDAVISSPVRRALETARPSAQAAGVPLHIVEGLREVSFGLAEGRTIGELTDLDPAMVERFQKDPAAHPFPGAEPPEEAADRAAQALRDLAEQFSGGKVLVVAHNTLLRLAICQLLDLPVARYRNIFPRLDNAAISEMSVEADPEGISSLHSLNVHLEGGADPDRPQ